MNHFVNWKRDPVYEPRPHDLRLRRVYVFKRWDDGGSWRVAIQSRNSATTEWRIREQYEFEKFGQAIKLASLVEEW